MDRAEYCGRVLAHLRRLTGAERAAVRAELDGHIEDHMEGLLDLGYPPALAEERTLAAMGDPAEVGRALDRQYPLRWLAAKWAAQTAAVALLALLAWQVWDNGADIRRALDYRFDADLAARYEAQYPGLRPCDIRVPAGTQVLRVYGAGVRPGGGGEAFPDAAYTAVTTVCCYDASWRHLGRRALLYPPQIANGSGQGGFMAYGGTEAVYVTPVEFGEPALYGRYRERGFDLRFEIPLDWEGVA